MCGFFSISNFCLGATEVNYWRLRKLWDRSFEFSGYLGALVKGYRVSIRRNGQKHSRSSQIWILVWIIRARGLRKLRGNLAWKNCIRKQTSVTKTTLLKFTYTVFQRVYWRCTSLFHYPLLKIRNSRLQGVLQISSDRDDRRIFGVWNFRFWDFLWHRKILASIFLGSLIKYGFFWLFHSHVSFCVVAYDTLWRLWNPRDFGGVWFLAPLNHPCHLKSWVPPPPLPRIDIFPSHNSCGHSFVCEDHNTGIGS